MTTYQYNEMETSLKVYLQEIGQTPLLTPAEEVALAKRIQRGDAQARTHMIKANLRLVVKIAQDYANMGLPLLDMISEGNIGLMKAVERFDPRKGAKLSTYAAWWIKQSIRRALANQGKTIRLPVHMVDRISKMHKASFRLTEELGREPTDDELAEHMGQSSANVAQLRRISMRPSSLDAPIGDDETQFSDVVMDENADDAYDVLHNKTLHEDVRLLLKDLDEREALILTMRYGLNGNRPMTLEEVGRKFKVTRERIRQLQNLALTRLRRSMEKRDRPLVQQHN